VTVSRAFTVKVLLHFIAILFLGWASVPSRAQEGGARPAGIPEAAIARLQDDLVVFEESESTTASRRASKKLFRGAEALIDRYPASPDRFRVLGIVFDMQKQMFAMRQTEEIRDALLLTARQLGDAPDEHAALRVEPDMMMLQIELAGKKHTPEERALALAQFADRYRGTSAEAMSLMMAATHAFDLGNRELLNAFRETLSKHFGDDPLVVAFMRERYGTGSTIHLGGAFKRADGTRLSFPIGQTYVVCFWSLDAPLLKEKVAEIIALQVRYKGQFKVFSFNLDELPDGGSRTLKRMGLDWVPMMLPGGSENPIYQSVGGANLFAALVIGPRGLASKAATGRNVAALHKTYEASVESPRRLALLRSLSSGEFLVDDRSVPADTTLPQATLREIEGCFVLPPTRWRLTQEQALTNYQIAEQLCGTVLAAHAGVPDLWWVHNRRTIALLGMWRLSGEVAYLDRAVASATAAMALELPPGAETVPQFCMATKALMRDGADAGEVLAAFTDDAGGTQAPGAAYAAALMLALDAHSRDAYLTYRAVLISDYVEEPSTWRVAAFLLDSSVASRLFERALPGGTISRGPAAARRFPSGWESSEGDTINLPGATNGALSAAVFMEPTDDRNAAALRKRVVDHLVRTAGGRPLKDLNVVGVFGNSDTNRVSALMKQNRWDFPSLCLTKSDWERSAREVGVCSADLRPNVFLIRPDGTMMLALSGVSADTENPDTLNMRIDVALRDHALGLADKALARQDYAEYAARLATSFPLKNRRLARHEPANRATSAHGRKLIWAYMQAKEWTRALAAANANIAAQQGTPNPRDTVKWCRVCHGHLYDAFLRMALLRKMGSTKEADAALALVDVPKCPHGKTEAALWEGVAADMKGRIEHPRFRRYSDPKVYLAAYEAGIRAKRQNLYGFGMESDLMMRSQIHEKLGNRDAATSDRLNANVRAWPFAVRAFDPELLHEASVARRKLAREHLALEEWKEALTLLNRNIEIHEAEARRCNSMCKICSAQVQSFGFYARTLEGLGQQGTADASRHMAEEAKCPPGKDLESFKSFPVNRMYGGGSGINRLNFIEGIMRGEGYANRTYREYRMELASDLALRAEALEQLGEGTQAAVDLKRATALAYPHGPRAASGEGDSPKHYVDILGAKLGSDSDNSGLE
jgi:hypothetical protein